MSCIPQSSGVCKHNVCRGYSVSRCYAPVAGCRGQLCDGRNADQLSPARLGVEGARASTLAPVCANARSVT
jgi:hypothetical protein